MLEGRPWVQMLSELRLSETHISQFYDAQLFLEFFLPAFFAFFLQLFEQNFFRSLDLLQECFQRFIVFAHAFESVVKATIQVLQYIFSFHGRRL